MKVTTALKLTAISTSLFTLTACGGGGDDDSINNTVGTPPNPITVIGGGGNTPSTPVQKAFATCTAFVDAASKALSSNQTVYTSEDWQAGATACLTDVRALETKTPEPCIDAETLLNDLSNNASISQDDLAGVPAAYESCTAPQDDDRNDVAALYGCSVTAPNLRVNINNPDNPVDFNSALYCMDGVYPTASLVTIDSFGEISYSNNNVASDTTMPEDSVKIGFSANQDALIESGAMPAPDGNTIQATTYFLAAVTNDYNPDKDRCVFSTDRGDLDGGPSAHNFGGLEVAGSGVDEHAHFTTATLGLKTLYGTLSDNATASFKAEYTPINCAIIQTQPVNEDRPDWTPEYQY